MISDLLSLSLTDMPLNKNKSVRTSEAIDMIFQTGGEFEYNNSTNLIIGIALLVIAIVIFIGESNWTTITADVEYLNCNMSNCTLGVNYLVNGMTYKKDFTVSIDYQRPSDNKVDLSYESGNPATSYLGPSNYNNYIYIFGGLGILFLGIWFTYLNKSEGSSSFIPTLNFSSKTETPGLIYSVSE
jgi:hypothetical protein